MVCHEEQGAALSTVTCCGRSHRCVRFAFTIFGTPARFSSFRRAAHHPPRQPGLGSGRRSDHPERYGHLAPDFKQPEMAKFRLGVEAPIAATAAREGGGRVAPVLRPSQRRFLWVQQPRSQETKRPGVTGPFVLLNLERETGFEPATLSLGRRVDGTSTFPTVPNPLERLGQGRTVTFQPTQPTSTVPNRLAASLLQGPNAPSPAGAAPRLVGRHVQAPLPVPRSGLFSLSDRRPALDPGARIRKRGSSADLPAATRYGLGRQISALAWLALTST
jgi:hypothetical protein